MLGLLLVCGSQSSGRGELDCSYCWEVSQGVYLHCTPSRSFISDIFVIRFIGLFGIYFSLQYLSLSDATVLTFLAPICTVFTGAILLGETFSHRQILAGSKQHIFSLLPWYLNIHCLVISLVGVILIARPTFLFGSDTHLPYPSNGKTIVTSSSQESMPTERLIAVGCVSFIFHTQTVIELSYRVALLGVFGATGACPCWISSPQNWVYWIPRSDTTLRAIGRRAHPLHSMSFFSGICVLNASIRQVVYSYVRFRLNNLCQYDRYEYACCDPYSFGVAFPSGHDWHLWLYCTGNEGHWQLNTKSQL